MRSMRLGLGISTFVLMTACTRAEVTVDVPERRVPASIMGRDDGEARVVPPTYVPGFPGSTMINGTDGDRINGWVGTPGQRWARCYSKGADGGNSARFHAQCDNKGPTISVARLDSGRVIGGYASKSWASSGNWMGDDQSFLFSLTYNFKHRFIGNQPHYSQYSATGYGPTFGGGHDWHVNGELKGGYCYIGYTFTCRIGKDGGLDDVCRSDFCGSYDKWKVEDLEVWVK